MSLEYYATLDRLQDECLIKNVQLYGYEDSATNYERVGLGINNKLHWLDLQDFTLEELKPQLEVLGLCLNLNTGLWGIFNGIIGVSNIKLSINHYDRSKVDINKFPTTNYKSVSDYSNGDNPWWDCCDLASNYDLGEKWEEDEDDGCNELNQA